MRCGCAKLSIAAYTHEPESLYPPNISHLPIIPPSPCFVLLLLPGLKTDIFRWLKALPPYTSTYSRLQYTGSGRDKLKDVAEIDMCNKMRRYIVNSLSKNISRSDILSMRYLYSTVQCVLKTVDDQGKLFTA
jgi:hypothetical protein